MAKWLLAAAMMLSLVATAAAEPAKASRPFAFLSSWVGRYPDGTTLNDALDDSRTPSPSAWVWNNAALKAALLNILGDTRFSVLTGAMTTESPIDRRGRWVHINVCEPHNCPHSADVFIDVTGSAIGICWAEDDPRERSLWFSTGRAPVDVTDWRWQSVTGYPAHGCEPIPRDQPFQLVTQYESPKFIMWSKAHSLSVPSRWWIYDGRSNACGPATQPPSPAYIVEFDQVNGLTDHINDLGDEVEVDEPLGNGMIDIYRFFRSESACDSYIAARTHDLDKYR